MSNSVKAYLTIILAAGTVALATALRQWESPNLPRFLCFFALALAGSALKVKLPRMAGTYSTGFVFVLIGIAEFPLSELVVATTGIALVQCLWKPERRPNVIQVLFNIAALAISTAVSFDFYQYVLGMGIAGNLFVLLAVVSLIFFVMNTLLVAGIQSLDESKSLKDIWQRWYMWSFPYYLVGSVIAGIIIESDRYFDWKYSLLMLPLIYAVHVYYRLYVQGMQSKTA